MLELEDKKDGAETVPYEPGLNLEGLDSDESDKEDKAEEKPEEPHKVLIRQVDNQLSIAAAAAGAGLAAKQ